MRATLRIGAVLLIALFVSGTLFADDDKEEKTEKKRKLTKEEKKELREKKKQEKKERAKKMALAKYGKKLFNQATQYSTTGKGCQSCHTMGGEHDLAGKVTDETEAGARDAIKKCVENRMKASEDKAKLEKWNKGVHNVDALIEYLKLMKPRGRR